MTPLICEDPNYINALGNYIQSYSNLKSILFAHNEEHVLRSVIEKFEQFTFVSNEKRCFSPISLSSDFYFMKMNNLFPFETELIVKILKKELESQNKETQKCP